MFLKQGFCDFNFVASTKEERSSVVDEQRRQHRASAWIQVLPPSSFGASDLLNLHNIIPAVFIELNKSLVEPYMTFSKYFSRSHDQDYLFFPFIDL